MIVLPRRTELCDDDEVGDGATAFSGDCDDGNNLVYPGNAETTCAGLDNDCDQSTLDNDCNDDTGCPDAACDGDPACIAVVVDGLQSGSPLAAGTQPKPGVKWCGDCAGTFDGAVWTPPNCATNIDDAVAAIKTFQDPNAFNATHVSVTDMEPAFSGSQINKLVNINDVFSIILGFQGAEYPGPEIELCTDP